MKKINARLAILLYIAVFVHVIYQGISYVLFIYAPVVTKILGYGVVVPAAAHAILSVISVFVLHDSKTVLYKKANAGTLVQRISAMIFTVLLPVHIYSFAILSNTVGSYLYYLTELSQVIFYAALFVHMALSFGKALITLGILEDAKKKRVIDVAAWIICMIMFVTMSILVVTTHFGIFGL